MSVGHVARLFESAGIATVIIAVEAFENRMRMMSLPRVLLTPFLLGRPIGPPEDRETHQTVIEAALDLLETADSNGSIRRFNNA